MSLEYMEKLPDLIKEGNVSKLRECISRIYGDSISDKKNIDRIFDIPAEILTVIKLSDFIDAIYEGSYYESEEEDLLKKAVENKIGDINFIGRKFDLPYIIYMLQKFNIDKEDYAQTLFDISVKSNRYSDVLYCINNLNINIDCIHYIEASDGYSTLKLKLIEKLKENGKIKLMAETLSNDGDNLLHIISKRLVVSRIEENMKACDISQKDLKKMSLAKNNANNTPFYEFLLTVKNRTKKPDGPYENILNNLIKDGDLNLFF